MINEKTPAPTTKTKAQTNRAGNAFALTASKVQQTRSFATFPIAALSNRRVLKIIAEAWETKPQIDAIAQVRVNSYSGFLVGRPMTISFL